MTNQTIKKNPNWDFSKEPHEQMSPWIRMADAATGGSGVECLLESCDSFASFKQLTSLLYLRPAENRAGKRLGIDLVGYALIKFKLGNPSNFHLEFSKNFHRKRPKTPVDLLMETYCE